MVMRSSKGLTPATGAGEGGVLRVYDPLPDADSPRCFTTMFFADLRMTICMWPGLALVSGHTRKSAYISVSKGLGPKACSTLLSCCDRFSRPHPPRTNVNRRDSCLSPLVTLTQKIPDRTCAPVASRPSQRRLTAPGPPTP